MEHGGGAWCPANPIGPGSYEWISVKLRNLHVLTGIELQGRFGNGQGVEFAEAFKIHYKRGNSTGWREYKNNKQKSVGFILYIGWVFYSKNS